MCLEESGELMFGAGILIKNCVGVTALIVLLAVGCIPVLKLACMSVLYKLAAAVAEPVADKRIVGCIKSVEQGRRALSEAGLLWHCTVFCYDCAADGGSHITCIGGRAMNAYMRGFVILFVLLVLLSSICRRGNNTGNISVFTRSF